MDHGHLRMVADKCQWVFSAPLLHACGTDVKCCRRQRILTPFRLGLALTATGASQRGETSADLHCGFHALFRTTITYQAFYHQVAKPHCAAFARTMTERLLSAMTLKGLGCEQGRALSACRHIVMQAGSALAIHDGWREVLPGRCKTVQPAAVARHTTLDLRCAAPTTVVLPPDTTHEQTGWPAPAALRASGLLADRGEVDRHSLRRVQEAGGFLLIRAKAGRNPQVLEAFREAGTRGRSLRHPPLQTIHAHLPKRQRGARVVPWHVDGCPLCLRLLRSWQRRTKRCGSFLTNLPSPQDPLAVICRAYTGSWPVELLLKAWQSYAQVPAFDTAKPPLVAGLLWIAMAAAALKRFLAHMTQRLAEVPMSTRKVAMGAIHVGGNRVEAGKRGDLAGVYAALETALTSLACHAQRAHPTRDRQTGRAQRGLEPSFENDGMIEFAEAA